GLSWRIQAWKTGRSFAEVALANSLVYRTEYAILIHRPTAEILHCETAENSAPANQELFSGLLLEINEFIKDVFQTEDANVLRTIEFEDRLVWLEGGKRIVLAVIFTGLPPLELRLQLRKIILD